MIDTATHKRIEDKILEVLLLAQQIYKQPFDIPALEYRQMGRTAGKAWQRLWKIELNPDFCRNGHLEDMIHNTLPHELAHLISYKVYGPILGGGHGRFWKSVMVRLGLEPKRCHNYSLEGVKTRKKAKNPVICPTCETRFDVTDYRVKQILGGAKIWHNTPVCRRVRKPLVLVNPPTS
jgi:predicted SprT family Zn-dependent metalloprotease